MPKISPQTIPIMEGAALLVRRPNTPRWQVKYKVANHWMRTSTKTADIDAARKAAVEIVLDAMHREKFGLPVVTRSFKSIAKTAIKRMEKELDEGQGKKVYKDYIQALENYYIPYFGTQHITNVNYKALNEFSDWRTEKLKRTPRSSTINTHTSALNRVFDEAMMLGYITQAQIPRPKNKGADGQRRRNFSLTEYTKLHRFMRTWVIEKVHRNKTREMRLLLRDLVLILANTGIRYGTETYNLKWKHLSIYHDKKKEKEYLQITVTGKTKERELIARKRCKGWFARIHARAEDLKHLDFEEMLDSGVDEYVFRLPDGTRSTNLHQTFRKLLTDAKLLECRITGQHRTLYSLRHTYATFALMKSIDIYKVAVQMGTSVKMLEKHYSHLRAFDARDELSGQVD